MRTKDNRIKNIGYHERKEYYEKLRQQKPIPSKSLSDSEKLEKDMNQAILNLSEIWYYDQDYYTNHDTSLILASLLGDHPNMPMLEGIVLLSGLVKISVVDLYKWINKNSNLYKSNMSFGENVEYVFNPKTDGFINRYLMKVYITEIQDYINRDINTEIKEMNDAIAIRNEKRKKKNPSSIETPLVPLIQQERIDYVRRVVKEMIAEFDRIYKN